MTTRAAVAMGLVVFLMGLGIGILGFGSIGPAENPVVSGVGNIQETVFTDTKAQRIAESAVRLDAVGPVTDEMLSKSVEAVAAKATSGDVEALSVLVEIVRLQRERQ